MKAKEQERLAKKEMMDEIQEELIIYFRQGIINVTKFVEAEEVQFHKMYDIVERKSVV